MPKMEAVIASPYYLWHNQSTQHDNPEALLCEFQIIDSGLYIWKWNCSSWLAFHLVLFLVWVCWCVSLVSVILELSSCSLLWSHLDVSLLISIQILTLSDPTSDLVRHYDFPILLRCRVTSDTFFFAFVRPLHCRSLSDTFFLCLFAHSTVGACPTLLLM